MCTQKRGNIYIVSNSSRGCGNNNSNSTNYLKTSTMMMMLPMSESSANKMILSPQRKNSILINLLCSHRSIWRRKRNPTAEVKNDI